MAHAGRECRIQAIHVHRHVHRPVDQRPHAGRPRAHVDDFHAEARCLLLLVRRQRADADLHQPARQPFLHDARERAGMRIPIALELVVQVRMRIDVQDGRPRKHLMHGTHDGIRDGMIPAERDHAVPACQHTRNAGLDQAPGARIVRQNEITRVGHGTRRTEVHQVFGPVVSRCRPQRLANSHRRLGSTPKKRRAGVVRQAEQAGRCSVQVSTGSWMKRSRHG